MGVRARLALARRRQGRTSLLNEAILRRHLPDERPTGFRYFLCGPVPLTAAAETALVGNGVTPSHIRIELFEPA